MATPRKVNVYPKTSVKNAIPKACIACARHLAHPKLIRKNAALQFVYMDLLKILEIDISKLELIHANLYICESCIHLTSKIKSLRETSQAYVKKLLNSEESRFKRMLIHSASPNERKKTCSNQREEAVTTKNKTKKSKISLKFHKKLPSTDQMVSKCESEIREANSEFSTGEITLLEDHMYAASTDQPESSPGADHINYCRRDTASVYRDHSIIKSYATDSFPSHEIENLSKLLTSGLESQQVASKIMQLPHLAAAIRNAFLQEITFTLDRLCGTGQKSALRSSFGELSDKSYFNKVITEMEQRCPLVLDILIAMCCPAHHNLKDTDYTVAAIYGALLTTT